MSRFGNMAALCGVLICVALLPGCGASKEMLPARAPDTLPDFPIKEKKLPDPNTLVVKEETLLLTGPDSSLSFNVLNVADGAETAARITKEFKVPIQFDGWLTLTGVTHSLQKCSGPVKEPRFFLTDDFNGQLEMIPEQKFKLVHEKLYKVKALYENEALCTSIDIQFGVLYGE